MTREGRMESDGDRPEPDPFGGGTLPPWRPDRAGKKGRGLWRAILGVAGVAAACVAVFLVWRAFQPAPLLLRIHGSTTIGEKLMPELAVAFLQREHYTGVAVGADDPPGTVHVHGWRAGRRWQVEIVSAGSETGFRDLAAGTADIAMSSEKISPEQVEQLKLKGYGDLSSEAGEHVIALDGVAVIVHAGNPVSRLTLARLAEVFGGAAKDWAEVGGNPGPIHVYARDNDSGTWRIFKDEVLGKYQQSLVPSAQRIRSSEALSDAVAQDVNGIGFIGLNYAGTNKVLSLADQDVQDLVPTACTLKTEEYVLTRRLYLYTPANPQPAVHRLIDFATSADAWPTVTRAHQVSLDPTPVANCRKTHSAEYIEATRGAERMLVNFTFQSGSDRLDTRAQAAVHLLIAQLSDPRYAGCRLLLMGFADNVGTLEQSRQVAQRRANAVRGDLLEEISREGMTVPIDVDALGAQDFIAPNDTDKDRQRNRRVEVWVRRQSGAAPQG